MSTFPTSEPFQARWYHLPKHHDTNSFLPLHHTSCGLQEGQLHNPPLRDKTSDVVNLSLLLHPSPSKDKQELDCDFQRCGHTFTGYEKLKNKCIVAQGDDITRLDTGSEKGDTTFQAGVFSAQEHGHGLGQNAFQGSLHAPELVGRYPDLPMNIVKHQKEQPMGDLLMMNNSAVVELLTESNGDLKEQGNAKFDNNVHGNTVAAKQTRVIDKKEMRARRNRESARRSRMKSKQHFQRLEQTFVLMKRENRALLVIIEKLLPNYIARFPHLTGRLQCLFEVGR